MLEKLRPDRDLQCYFERPSGIAALSNTGPDGFTVSGTWRQQFDWAVLEWNRDNVYEHPLFRNLPDGDLSGLKLSYGETRANCIRLDSDLFPTVEWPFLRVWTEAAGADEFFKIPLRRYAVPIEGSCEPAYAEFELRGSPTAGDSITLAWMNEHYTHQLYAADTLGTGLQALADSVNAFSTTMRANRTGTRIRLTAAGAEGANGNRIGVYSLVHGAGTESWEPCWQRLSGGISPTKWRIDLDFGALADIDGNPVPMNAVRKMRWTYSADLQDGPFQRSEFEVRVSNWTVTGTKRCYAVAGPGSRRIEDDSPEVEYTGTWRTFRGNFSGGSIRRTDATLASLMCRYTSSGPHSLYLGTRMTANGGQAAISIDGGPAVIRDLARAGEDTLIRVPIGEPTPGEHTVALTHTGAEESQFWFDYIEIAVPSERLPAIPADTKLALATDWDTDHSIALAPERTAWMIESLGFRGRVNHYAGALWFYELVRPGHEYASATVEFTGTPDFSAVTEIRISRTDEPDTQTAITHVNLLGDTVESIARALELEINRGYMAIRAESQGNVLTIWARAMGAAGNKITIEARPPDGPFTARASGPTLEGGVDGEWRTDLEATPRLNRAARDWNRAFFEAVQARGLEAVVSFSMELRDGDPSPEAGIAQRCPEGDPVLLNTPALQTNFSPASLAFWKRVYREAAELMAEAGLNPFLQFGEVQWWYFRDTRSGMPFYDAYTKERFRALHGRELAVIPGNDVSPALYPEEAAFLPALIGEFTMEVINFVRGAVPSCRFEVLYPVDVNDTEFNRAVNLPRNHWSAGSLDSLKTESFTYTYNRNLDQSAGSIALSKSLGFPPSKRSHLVGIADPKAAWEKEVRLAKAEGLEAVVLWALDQYALIGYPSPLPGGPRRSLFQGG
jgi:hypothetical protein